MEASLKKTCRIIIIDDEEIMRNCLKDVLADDGFDVRALSNGEEGLRLFEEISFEIAILDVKMPGISGVEVLKTIKKISPSTEVVMITGYASVSTAVESMKLGAFDYLTKPFDMDQIKGVINEIIKKISRISN